MSSQKNDVEFIANILQGDSEFRATGSGAMSATLTIDQDVVIVSILLHLSAAGGTAENFVAAVDSDSGAAYDAVLVSQDMETTSDIYDNEKRYLSAGDHVDFTYTNTNSRTWGLVVKYAKV